MPSLIQSITSPFFGTPAAAFGQANTFSPFGPGGGFPPLGTFQGIGSAQILSQFAFPGGQIPTIPQGFMVGGPSIGGIPAGGGSFFGGTPSPFGPQLAGAQPQLFPQTISAPLGFGAPVMGSPFGGAAPFGLASGLPFGQNLGAGASPFSLGGASPLAVAGGSPLQFAGLQQPFGGIPGASPLQFAGAQQPFGGLPGVANAGLSPFGAPPGLTPAAQNFLAPPLAAGPQGGGPAQMMQMLLSMMMMMLQMIMQMLNPQQARDMGGAGGMVAGLGPAGAGVAGAAAELAAKNAVPGGAPGLSNLSANPAQGAQLDRSLSAIANDPEGARLLAAARARGVTIEVGDPSRAGGQFDAGGGSPVACNCGNHSVAADGSTVVNGVTISNGQQTKIVVRDPNNIKTIVHELVHAVSIGDGNSREEEGIADVVGSRIANRIAQANGISGAAVGGLGGSDQQIFLQKQQFYPGLNQFNGIRDTLSRLGILVSV